MTFARTLMMTLVSLLTITAAQTVEAGSYRHIDELALQLQEQSRELYSEFKLHYRHVSDYRHLRSDSASLSRLASHIHSVAHRGGNIHHLESDMAKADRLFHHLEELVSSIEHNTRHHSGGHTHGDLRHVHSLMRSMESTLHHLKADVESVAHTRHSYHRHGRRYYGRVGVGYHWRGGGVRLSGNRVGIRIGF
jgi:hypothetical protein